FLTVGYHYIILNGYLTYADLKEGNYKANFDGALVAGRDENMIGAHTAGHNEDSIGICLIGVNRFTDAQMRRLEQLCIELLRKYNLKPSNVYGHYEFVNYKTCPNFDVNALRNKLWLLYNENNPS
ncbi:MAG: N-acetylmuramoyl-L-alanine amidase, partial [Candidatus Kryptonium sp.]